jgi:hypothetical protein
MATIMERLNNALKTKKPLSASLTAEYNSIRRSLVPNKRKQLDALMNRSVAGNKTATIGLRAKTAKKVISTDRELKARKGGNPEIQRKQGSMKAGAKGSFEKLKSGGKVKKAKGMARGGKMKAKGMARGGKAMMKKSKGMARGGKMMMKKSKGMARGGKMMKRSKGMARGGKAKR